MALAPSYVPAQLALVSALIDIGRLRDASVALHRIDSPPTPEIRGARARLRLRSRDYLGALRELRWGENPILGADVFLLEPTAGLLWPWLDAQVEALANSQLGHVKEAARRLGVDPVGTLPELRDAVAGHTKSGGQLMNEMAGIAENSSEEDVVRDEIAVSLGRLRVLAGQTDAAVALVTTNSARLTRFCAGLAELLWTSKERPLAAQDHLLGLCTSKAPGSPHLVEPAECALPPQDLQ